MTPEDDIKDDTMVDVPILSQGKRKSARMTRKRYASLIVVEGKEIGREFRLSHPRNVIGRDVEVNIRVIADPSVSRQHARLQVEYDPSRKTMEYVLTDLESTNRTFVNEEEIRECSLSDGDKIRVGDTVLKFMLQDEIDAKFQKEIQRRLNYDNLTGLLTRESFELAMNFELDRSRKNNLPLALLMMDLDFFKKVNDTWGHQAGSFVLSEVGKLIGQNFRGIDVSGRYGGEEFITYLAEVGLEGTTLAAERFRVAFAQHEFRFKEVSIRVTISIGIALFPQHGDTIEILTAHADRALYRAKNTGRDRTVVFEVP